MVMVRIGKDGFDRSPPPPHGQHSVAVLGPLQSACALVWRPPPLQNYLNTYYAIDGQAFGLMQKASSCLPKLPKAAVRQDICGMKWQNSQADFMSVAEKSTKKGLSSKCVHAITEKYGWIFVLRLLYIGNASRLQRNRQRRLLDSWNKCQGRFLRFAKKPKDLFTDLPSFSSAQQSWAGPSPSTDYATGLKCLLSVVLSQALLFDSVFFVAYYHR